MAHNVGAHPLARQLAVDGHIPAAAGQVYAPPVGDRLPQNHPGVQDVGRYGGQQLGLGILSLRAAVVHHLESRHNRVYRLGYAIAVVGRGAGGKIGAETGGNFAFDPGLHECGGIEDGGGLADVVGEDNAGHGFADPRRLLQRGGGVGDFVSGGRAVFAGQGVLKGGLHRVGFRYASGQ